MSEALLRFHSEPQTYCMTRAIIDAEKRGELKHGQTAIVKVPNVIVEPLLKKRIVTRLPTFLSEAEIPFRLTERDRQRLSGMNRKKAQRYLSRISVRREIIPGRIPEPPEKVEKPEVRTVRFCDVDHIEVEKIVDDTRLEGSISRGVRLVCEEPIALPSPSKSMTRYNLRFNMVLNGSINLHPLPYVPENVESDVAPLPALA